MKSIKNKTSPKFEWGQLYAIYERVLDVPLEARAELLMSLCPDRPDLRAEVLYLLENAESADKFLKDSAASRLSMILAPPSLKQGDTIEDFVILDNLGCGGFATVYRARQISLNREVALKVSPIFGHEGRTIAQLEHEGIVPVYSQTNLKDKNLRLIAMQYVPNVTLEALEITLATLPPSRLTGKVLLETIDRAVVNPAALTTEDFRGRERIAAMDFTEIVAWIGGLLAHAMTHAHGKGVLHLDIKPSNILLPINGRPRLTDFNVSVEMESLAIGVPSHFGGTAEFMAPEHQAVFNQLDKASAVRMLDGRADIYSLGIVLKRLLDLEKNNRPPEAIDWIVARAHHSNPARRYPDAAAFARALEGFGELKAICASLPPLRPWLQIVQRHPVLSLSLLGAVPQILGCTFGITYNSIRIVENLNLRQQELFRALNWIYNPILYLVVSALWTWGLYRLAPVFRRPAEFVWNQEELAKLRNHLSRMPLYGIALTTLGWIPGSVVFPACLHFYGGGLSVATSSHFFISFFLSYCISLAYSYLLHEWVLLRTLYPSFWPGAEAISETARKELAMVPARVRGACVLASLIPLLGAAILILVGPDLLEGEKYRIFRILMASLLLMGGIGVSFAMGSAHDIGRILVRFTNRPQNGRPAK